MATIKSYTDLPQSETLSKILPIESADMWWLYITAHGKYIAMMHEEPDPHYIARMESYGIKDAAIRCWSLAALLSVLPKRIELEGVAYELSIYLNGLYYWNVNNGNLLLEVKGKDNLVDACVAMIEKLYELKML